MWIFSWASIGSRNVSLLRYKIISIGPKWIRLHLMRYRKKIDLSLSFKEFSKQNNLDFRKEKFKRHVLFYNQRSWNPFRILLVRKQLKCPIRIESSTTTSVESFRRLVNSRNFERVRRQIIGVSTCRNICRNIDILWGSCCFIRISVISRAISRCVKN